MICGKLELCVNGELSGKTFLKKFSHVYGRVIVTSSTPNLKASPDYVNLVKLIKKTYHGNIKIVKNQFFEKDINLAEE
jgi:hypothetical protein